MKRIIPIIIGTLAITACGGTKTVYVDKTDAPETTAKVVKTTDAPIATPAPTLPAWSEEDEFLYDVESSYGGVIYVDDQQMIDTARTVCDGLLSGMSGNEVVWAITNAGGDSDLVIAVVAAAVANFCPSQMYKFG
jgi:hypothetical protein